MISIKLNGTAHEMKSPVTVRELLESLGLGGKPVVVEVDEVAVFPREYGEVRTTDGARVEIVALAAGG